VCPSNGGNIWRFAGVNKLSGKPLLNGNGTQNFGGIILRINLRIKLLKNYGKYLKWGCTTYQLQVGTPQAWNCAREWFQWKQWIKFTHLRLF